MNDKIKNIIGTIGIVFFIVLFFYEQIKEVFAMDDERSKQVERAAKAREARVNKKKGESDFSELESKIEQIEDYEEVEKDK